MSQHIDDTVVVEMSDICSLMGEISLTNEECFSFIHEIVGLKQAEEINLFLVHLDYFFD